MQTAQQHAPPESEASILKRHERLIGYVARPFARQVDIDDLMQEGRVALLGAARSFDPNVGVQLWTYARKFVLGAMFAAATRECENTSNRADEPSDDSGGVDDLQAAGPSPEARLETAECVAIMTGEMHSLSAEERRIIRLEFGEDLSLAEIARSHGVSSHDKARNISRGAIAKLRERVGARL